MDTSTRPISLMTSQPGLEQWGDCCLEAGPFVFFGDRELLARVRDALGMLPPEGAAAGGAPGRHR